MAGRRDLCAVLWAVAFVAGVAEPPHLHAQTRLDSLGSSVAWRVNGATAAGVLEGLVLSEDGESVEGAQVLLLAGADGIEVGATTGADGRFEVDPPRPGEWEIKVRSIGFRTATDTVTVPHDRGVFAVALLQASRMHGLCGTVRCLGTSCGDLDVRVVDSITGLPPDGPVTLRLSHPGGVLERSVTLSPGTAPFGHIGTGAPVESVGPHSIEVQAPGYRPWRVEDVYLELVPGCVPTLLNRHHVARLRR